MFYKLKKLALNLSENYKSDGSRIAWVSIRLPSVYSETHFNESDIMLSSIYAQNEILSVVVADLALRKIGLESLVMICSNAVSFKTDFLNRVRLSPSFFFKLN